MPDDSRAPKPAWAEAAVPVLLIGWRILVQPAAVLWSDWMLILSLYWIFTIFASRSRAWPAVTAGTMMVLAVVYFRGQLPHTLASLGLGS